MTCSTDTILVRADRYYRPDENGEPTGERVSQGGENIWYCENCGDVSYSWDSCLDHIEGEAA